MDKFIGKDLRAGKGLTGVEWFTILSKKVFMM